MDNTKLGGVINTLEDRIRMQLDLHRIEDWEQANEIKFNRDKYKVLHLANKNLLYKYPLACLDGFCSPFGS